MAVTTKYFSPEKLKTAMRKADMDTAALAVAVSRTTRAVSNWKSGKIIPPKHLIPVLAKVLTVGEGYFFV